MARTFFPCLHSVYTNKTVYCSRMFFLTQTVPPYTRGYCFKILAMYFHDEMHSVVRLMQTPLASGFTHPPTHPLTHSLTHPLTHSLTHPPSHPPTHSLTHSPTHSPTHSLAHSLKELALRTSSGLLKGTTSLCLATRARYSR